MIRGVCFDMDGVLFDTETLGSRVMRLAGEMQGVHLNDGHWHALIGMTMQQTIDTLHGWFPGMDAAHFIDDWKAQMLLHVEKHGMPFKPGVKEVLALCRERGIRLALCTSNDPDVIERYLEIAGWEDVFRPVVTRLMIANPKPAPDCYLKAAELMGLSPSECIGVEDSPTGVKAVRAAGMTSVMVPDVIPFREELRPYVDWLLKDLNELARMIENDR